MSSVYYRYMHAHKSVLSGDGSWNFQRGAATFRQLENIMCSKIEGSCPLRPIVFVYVYHSTGNTCIDFVNQDGL